VTDRVAVLYLVAGTVKLVHFEAGYVSAQMAEDWTHVHLSEEKGKPAYEEHIYHTVEWVKIERNV